MSVDEFERLSMRERQIMLAVYERGEASAAEIGAAIEDPPSYSAVRALIRILVEKGKLKVRREGKRNLYTPTTSTSVVKLSAARNLLRTFFGGSIEQAMSALLSEDDFEMSAEELERLEALVREKRKAKQ